MGCCSSTPHSSSSISPHSQSSAQLASTAIPQTAQAPTSNSNSTPAPPQSNIPSDSHATATPRPNPNTARRLVRLSRDPSNTTPSSTSSLAHQQQQQQQQKPPLPHRHPSSDPHAPPPNSPLRLPSASTRIPAPLAPSGARLRTAAALTALRTEFFDTRTSGRREMWDALRSVAEMLGAGDVASAQAVLDAVGATCPSGEVWSLARSTNGLGPVGSGAIGDGRRPSVTRSGSGSGSGSGAGLGMGASAVLQQQGQAGRKKSGGGGGVFDEWGERYTVPIWCIGWPGSIPRDGSVATETDDTEQDDDHEDNERNIMLGEDEKLLVNSPARSNFGGTTGKGKEREGPILGNEVKIRVRLSHTGRDAILKVGDRDPIQVVLRRIRNTTEIPHTMKIRLVYLGRMLSEEETLESTGWKTGHILNLFAFETYIN